MKERRREGEKRKIFSTFILSFLLLSFCCYTSSKFISVISGQISFTKSVMPSLYEDEHAHPQQNPDKRNVARGVSTLKTSIDLPADARIGFRCSRRFSNNTFCICFFVSSRVKRSEIEGSHIHTREIPPLLDDSSVGMTQRIKLRSPEIFFFVKTNQLFNGW